MSNYENLVLRKTNHPPLTNKDARLNSDDYDGNLIKIFNALLDMNKGGEVKEYDNAFEYLANETYYVTYDSRLWQFISDTNQTGVTPGTDDAIWVQATIGDLVHQKNRDTKLDEGGANEVSASEIKSSNLKITKTLTKAQINSLHTTPIPITSEDLGLEGAEFAIIEEIIWEKDIDGTVFSTGEGAYLGVESESGDFLYLSITRQSIIENTNGNYLSSYVKNIDTSDSSRTAKLTDSFRVGVGAEITGGGAEATIKLHIYYRKITL